ncbi:unnamed protein product [Miscanthus lutarioriparius]|uniref:Uncharacterized protein n=1 Tax=Miscanthus lutarioriparius TaxID=422564 RepID=A0A811Q3P2_9POAL|nr:unnamed protein product [Miscanthus lutarioriparius]
MATVTQGVLLRLLQAMHTEERVAGEHRSPVLQVTAVVPALTASTSDSPLLAAPPSNGVLLNLSDGLHCTYVQVPPADADALLAAARPQLVGHLVHLDRLRFARPVPRAVGLRTVPSSRPLPCVGKPEPLVARPASCARGYVIQPAASAADAAPPLMPSSSNPSAAPDASETAAVKRTVLGPKNAVADPAPQQPVKRRFSSPAPPSKHRDPSPAAKPAVSRASSPSVGKSASRASSPAVRGTPRATSPAPSKCVVPSLVAAREENRRVVREPAILVPSRYRQPSPAGGRRVAASPAVGGGRRTSLSPGSRRLSGEGTGKKKVGVLVAGISKMSDLGSGSAAKPGRKSWDDPTVSLGTAAPGSVMKSKAKVDKDSILRTQEAMSRRLSDATTEQSSNDDSSVDERPKPRKKIESTSVKAKTTAPKIILHDPKWTDGSIPLDAIPDKLSKIGKEAFERRDLAATAAASALQEALVSESVIRNISKFSEICASSKVFNPFPTVDLFLVVYEDTLKWKTISESMVTNGAEEEFFEKSTKHWVGAALATDLEVLKLLNGATGSFSRTRSTNKPNASSVEPPRTNLSKKPTHGASAKVQSKVAPSSPLRCTWSNTESTSETAELAKSLWREMHTWFLTFVDEALDVGFHLFEDQNVASKGKHSSHITMVLSQFKKISDWLDQVGKIAEEERTKEKIECLKRKIYGFVISHMGSAFESSVSVSSRS